MPPIAIFIALADPTRCRIVEILRDGPQPVHVLAAFFDISRPAISRHLRVLKQARLISEKKSGRENRYALHLKQLRPVAGWLAALAPAEPEPPAPAPIAAMPPAASAPSLDEGSVTAVPKPRRVAPVSQMGFDF